MNQWEKILNPILFLLKFSFIFWSSDKILFILILKLINLGLDFFFQNRLAPYLEASFERRDNIRDNICRDRRLWLWTVHFHTLRPSIFTLRNFWTAHFGTFRSSIFIHQDRPLSFLRTVNFYFYVPSTILNFGPSTLALWGRPLSLIQILEPTTLILLDRLCISFHSLEF